jgi:chromosome segregation ATPase
MTKRSTADIIPLSYQNRPPSREPLDRSLARLKTALAEQSAAIAAWRSQLERLRVGLGALGRSLDEHNARLGTAKQGVTELNAQARRLEAWADGVLTR